jgi:pimeloyl-[acyl-carrier protein] methyl ester esterase
MKPTLALIHGWAIDSSAFDPIRSALEKNFEIYAHDLPGYGSRHDEAGDLSLQALTEDARERIPDGAIWMGWSLGGTIAMKAAIETSNEVSQLILVSVTPKLKNSGDWKFGIDANIIDELESKFENNFSSALKRFLLMGLGDPIGGRSVAVEAAQRCLQPPTLGTLVSGLNILRQTDLRDQVSKINCPVQLMVGSRDKIVPADATRWLESQLTDVQLSETNVGHLSFLESPHWFINQLTSFLESASAAHERIDETTN